MGQERDKILNKKGIDIYPFFRYQVFDKDPKLESIIYQSQ